MRSIKRPAAVIGFSIFISGSIALSMPKEYTAILLALFALFAFVHFKTKRLYTKHLLLMLASAVISMLYVDVYGVVLQKKIDSIPRDIQHYTGYVSSINNSENTVYTVTILDDKNRDDYKVTLYYHDGFTLGDKLSINGKFQPVKKNRYIFSSYADNILGTISAEEIELSQVSPQSLGFVSVKAKKSVLDSMSQLYRKDILAVASAISYNDKHLLPQDIKDSFTAAGMSHALVVSGLHIGIVIGAVIGVLAFIPINKKIKNIAALIILSVFMYVAGLSASVIRAGVFAGVILVAKNFRKEQDSVTTLALIGLLCIIDNPYITRDVGAMLSYLASVGIILTNRWCAKRDIKGNRRNLLCAAMAVISTMPVIAMAEMRITVLSPVFNLLFAPVIVAVCVLSVATPVINLIPVVKYLALLLAKVNETLIISLLAILDFIKEYFSFALVNLAHPVFVLMLFSAVGAYFVAYFQTDNSRIRKIFTTAVPIVVFLCYNLLNWNTATVTVFDSGRECSFHICAKGREYLVLSEEVTTQEAKRQLVSVNEDRFDAVYHCPKDTEKYLNLDSVAEEVILLDRNTEYENEIFCIESDITKNSRLFTISVADCSISFGHGKVQSKDSDYYFLGNDKPKAVSAKEIYIFGNIPKWMEVEDIYSVNSDLTIKINLKTGEYKTVEDVFNFG